MTREHTMTASVSDWENITVPAGNFRAIKITTTTETKDFLTEKMRKGSDISWYAPEVRKSIKTIAASINDDGTEDQQEIR